MPARSTSDYCRWGVYLLGGLLLVVLAGCASTGKQSSRDQMVKPEASQTRIQWPKAHWWQQFGDKQLDELVEEAMSANPDLQGARARAQKAAAQVQITGAQRRPHLGGQAEIQRRRFPKHYTTGEDNAGDWAWDNTAGLSLAWDLDIWGQHYQQEAEAIGQARAAEIDTHEARLALQTAVVRAYIELSHVLQLQAIAKKDLQRRQRLLDIAQQRHQAGLGTQMEVSRFKTRIPEARSQVQRLQAAIETMRHQLAALIGSTDPQAVSQVSPRLALIRRVPIPDKVPANLLGHRPDIVSARLLVEASQHGIEAARAAFYPDVNLRGFAGIATLGFNNIVGHDPAQYNVGPAVTLPIFEGGRLRGGLRQANAAYDMAVASYNGRVIAAMQEVADAISELESLDKRTREAARAVDSARHTYDMAQQGFQRGLTNQLNVLDAQQSLLDRQSQQADIRADKLEQYARLMQALGGGFAQAPVDRQVHDG